MTMRGQTIAIEGVSCAGKTTLVERLSRELPAAVVPELPAFGRNLFKSFDSRDGIIYNGQLSIGLERVRMVGAIGLSRLCDNVILDRSFLSTLAVNYGAVDVIGRSAFQDIARNVLSELTEYDLSVPDKTLYLSVDGGTVQERNETRVPRLADYWTDQARVERQNEFYHTLTGLDGFAYVDANRDRAAVYDDSIEFVQSEQRLSADALVASIELFVNKI